MNELQLIIRNARLHTDDPHLYTIGVRGGTIVALAAGDEDLGRSELTVDAAGRWVIPGAIDTHAHINQRAPEYNHLPGLGADDNFTAETMSAAAGGVTTVLNYSQFGLGSMLTSYRDSLETALKQTRINVLFHGHLMNMAQVAEIPEAVAAGVRTFKMFMPYRGAEAAALGGIGSLDHAQMRTAFRVIAEHGAQALVHAEDGDIVDHCMKHEIAEGLDSLASWERSRPVDAEGDAARTALYLAEQAGCPVTIVHVSSPEAIRARRDSGYENSSLESCVHYMLLTSESQLGPEAKVAPPLRERKLAAAVSDAVMGGEIDFFGSDHNVWPRDAKKDWVTARPGLPGIGLLLPLLLSHCVFERGMSMERAIALTSTNAARRFGLAGKGQITVGADADLVILDEGERKVQLADIHSAVDYSPYEGLTLRMWPAATFCRGTLVFENGSFPNDDFRGELLNLRFAAPHAALGRPLRV